MSLTSHTDYCTVRLPQSIRLFPTLVQMPGLCKVVCSLSPTRPLLVISLPPAVMSLRHQLKFPTTQFQKLLRRTSIPRDPAPKSPTSRLRQVARRTSLLLLKTITTLQSWSKVEPLVSSIRRRSSVHSSLLCIDTDRTRRKLPLSFPISFHVFHHPQHQFSRGTASPQGVSRTFMHVLMMVHPHRGFEDRSVCGLSTCF